jgi:hypothetical protein
MMRLRWKPPTERQAGPLQETLSFVLWACNLGRLQWVGNGLYTTGGILHQRDIRMRSLLLLEGGHDDNDDQNETGQASIVGAGQ